MSKVNQKLSKLTQLSYSMLTIETSSKKRDGNEMVVNEGVGEHQVVNEEQKAALEK